VAVRRGLGDANVLSGPDRGQARQMIYAETITNGALSASTSSGERGIRRVWGPGRHPFGSNLFSYYKDPEGNTVEYTAEVEQLTDPNRQPRLQVPLADVWVSANRA